MLLTLRILPAGSKLPKPSLVAGLLTLEHPMIGKIVRCPDDLTDHAEKIVGTISTTNIFPMGVLVKLDPPDDAMNGLWIQEDAYRRTLVAAGRLSQVAR